MNKHFLCLLLLGGAISGYAAEGTLPAVASITQQGVTVKGAVKDAKGEPIIGATVTEKGTKNATVTDFDGNYSLNVSSRNAVLVVTYIGYNTQEVKAGSDVTLEEDNALLNEVVVIGYGTQRKGDITSAVASVKAEDFNAGKIGDAAELVKGKIAGLTVVNASGSPTAQSSIRLRGITTLVGGLTPLILVDGIEGDLTTVAPENIASIDVLKDASAAAIYGTRGANGVILITTKGGKRDTQAQVTYNGYVTFSNWTKKAEFMDTHDVIYGKTQQDYLGYDTNWLDAITRKAGFKHNHDINISGGSRNATYAANVSYNKEEGIIRNTDNENFKMQLDYTQYVWNDVLKFNFNALVTRQKYTNTDASYAYRQAVIHNPSEPVYNEDGSYYENFNKLQYYNPVELQNEAYGNTRNRFSQLVGNVTVEPIKGWKTNLMISWGEGANDSENWTSPTHYSIVRQGYNGSASKSSNTYVNKSLELTSRYDAQWGEHRFNGIVGYSYLYNEYDGFNASNTDFSTTAFLWNNLGNGSFLTDKDHHASMGSYRNDDKLVGFFGRISYGYADKYNALVSIRHEGSSKFGENHKWATFPSVSLGWNIMNEEFMKSTKNWLDNLRLRVGYGVTGITPSEGEWRGSYLAQNIYNFAGYGDVMSMDGKWIKTLEVGQNPNPDLKWEVTKEWNFGLDYGFLNGRIHGTLDFYIKTTNDLLFWYNVPMPPNLYSQTLVNVGDMRNTGIEFMIEAIPVQTKDFEWTTTLTASHNKNKLLKLSNDLYETDNFQELWPSAGSWDPISVTTHCMEVGETLGDFWGLKFVGYDKDGFALVEASDGNGGWTVKQFNGNLNVKENRQRLGNGAPKVILGWSNTFKYKDFDLSMQFTSQLGYKILNAQRAFYENNSIAYNRLKSAADLHPAINTDGTPYIDPETGEQKMVTLSPAMQQGIWSDHLENGDFLKLTNLTLGYTFVPKGVVGNYIKKARIYANATNLFCITGYSGLDPEVDNNFMTPGLDYRDKYPTTRSFTVGLSLNF